MSHKIWWTAKKIAQRLALIEPLVYRQQRPLLPFRYKPLPGPEAAPPVGSDVDDNHWGTIAPNNYWGRAGLPILSCEPRSLYPPTGHLMRRRHSIYQ